MQRIDGSVQGTVTRTAALSKLQRLLALTPRRPWVEVKAALSAPGLSCAAGWCKVQIAAAEEASLKWRLFGEERGGGDESQEANRQTDGQADAKRAVEQIDCAAWRTDSA